MTQAAAILRPALKRAGVKRVIIIDDVYDPPRLDEIGGLDAAVEFFDRVEHEPECRRELKGLGVTLERPEDLVDELVAVLYEARAGVVALSDALHQLFAGAMPAEGSETEALRAELQGLGAEVVTIGRQAAQQGDVAQAEILFVDYLLATPEQRDEASRAATREILEQFRTNGWGLPLVVLMSSRNVTPDDVDAFRANTDVLGGMYHFVPKRELSRPQGLCLRLEALLRALPQGRRLHAFVKALDSAIEAARSDFMDEARALTLADFAHIEMLALQGDGQPLGDYLIWLFSTVLGDAVFDRQELSAVQREIDVLTFEVAPPQQKQRELSPTLAKMYHRAQFRRMHDAVGSHPRDPRGAAAPAEEIEVHLGDLFLDPGSSNAWVVISPECDLAYSPGSKTRPFPKDRCVALMPGRLEPIRDPLQPIDRLRARTEIFHHDEMTYRIVWNPKGVQSFELRKFTDWVSGRERPYRTRTPFALDLQRAYAADLMRIGMPVPPPFPQRVQARLLAADADGKVRDLLDEPAMSDVITFVAGEKEFCFLSDDLVQCILDKAPLAADRLDDYRGHLKNQGEKKSKLNKLVGRAKKVRALAGDLKAALDLRGPHEVPRLGSSARRATDMLCIIRDPPSEELYDTQWPMMLHLSPIPSVPHQSETAATEDHSEKES